MLDDTLVNEAIGMAAEGASQKDLWTYLFVSREDFTSWFVHGRNLVEKEYGRLGESELRLKVDSGELLYFDMLCLKLYKGIQLQRWLAKRAMFRLVSASTNPQLAFKYLEAVYFDQYNPKYADTEDMTSQEAGDLESATSFVMEEFLREEEDEEVQDTKITKDTDAEAVH